MGYGRLFRWKLFTCWKDEHFKLWTGTNATELRMSSLIDHCCGVEYCALIHVIQSETLKRPTPSAWTFNMMNLCNLDPRLSLTIKESKGESAWDLGCNLGGLS